MKKVFIATSRKVGLKCLSWAKLHTPIGFEITNDIAKADIIISVMYDRILKPNVVNSKLCYNFHPGILPDYKGVGIFTWVIINEEAETGVTLHLMNEGIDKGDIIQIRKFAIDQLDTAHSLFLKAEGVIFEMFRDWYFDLLQENYIATPQEANVGKTYYRRDLKKMKNLTKFVKAFSFPNKEPAFFYDEKAEKVSLNYKIRNTKE